jgi:hypothetical protein
LRQDLLFYGKRSLSDLLYAYPKMLAKEIEETDRNKILNASLSDLVDHFVSKFLLDVPKLKIEEAHSLEPEDIKVDVSRDFTRAIHGPGPHFIQGTAFTLVVPFDGDPDLFDCSPSTSFLSGVHAGIDGNTLLLRHERLDHDAAAVAAVKRDFEGRLAQIQTCLDTQRRDVQDWNAKLPDTARSLLDARRRKILEGLSLTESLGFPLKRRSSGTYSVPVARKRVVVQMPVPRATSYIPEPQLAIQVYEDILQAISSLSVMMERSPSAFASMGEEHLRDHILVILNSQFEGQATGETFNRFGKTDILIREKDRNVFIAECKFWDGPKSLTEAIDQVLGYTSWRDTKVAVIVFNRRKDISAVLAAVPKAAADHPHCKKQLPYQAEGGFRFLFGQKDDRNRDMVLSVLVFDVPSASVEEGAPAAPSPSAPAASAASTRSRKKR